LQGSRELPAPHDLLDDRRQAMRAVVLAGFKNLKDASYFRSRAEQTRGLSRQILQLDVRKTLVDLAQEYDELADDLERGALDLRHPELLPQRMRDDR
jgi:hypothetical protein